MFDIEGGSLALSGPTIARGRARNGGGILNHGDRPSLTDVVLRHSSARVLDGGLINGGAATLNDVTVAGDAARGGGIANNVTLSLTDVIIRGDSAGVGSGVFNTRRATLAWLRSPARGADPLGFPSNHRRTRDESQRSEV